MRELPGMTPIASQSINVSLSLLASVDRRQTNRFRKKYGKSYRKWRLADKLTAVEGGKEEKSHS